ncbi:MAG TPA: hypothetical protein VIH52_02155 [Candidatus Nanoarchaeia archaeon]
MKNYLPNIANLRFYFLISLLLSLVLPFVAALSCGLIEPCKAGPIIKGFLDLLSWPSWLFPGLFNALVWPLSAIVWSLFYLVLFSAIHFFVFFIRKNR